MKTHLFYFIAAFALGCVGALAARSALRAPHQDHAAQASSTEYAPMVNSPAAPATDPHAGHGSGAKPNTPAPTPPSAPTPAPNPHEGHPAAQTSKTVNTVCAICGMDVDPSIKPAVYQGKLIGFGCRACPPRFAKEPDRYGPAALANQVVEN